MPWWDGLDADTIGRLHDLYPELEAAAVVAVRRQENARQFARYAGSVEKTPEVDSLGRQREEWEPVEYVWFPEDTAASASAWLAGVLLAAGVVKGEPGRPTVRVDKDTMLEILRQSLERAASTATRPRPYIKDIAASNDVKRTWVTPIVKWVAAHQAETLQALAVPEIPSRFSAYIRD
jgi:hypothetical protein